MRVLVVDEETPLPLNSGKRLRTFNLLRPLAARHHIRFLCRYHEGIDSGAEDQMQKQGIDTLRVEDPIRKKSGARFYTALLANLFSSEPYSVSSHRSQIFQHAILKELSSKRFDLIHCEWTPYAANLEKFMKMPSVVAAHNVESMIWERNCRVERHPLKKLFLFLQWKKMHRFEKSVFPRFSRTIAVSETDRKAISEWVSPDRIDVVANGVDISYFRPSSSAEQPFEMVFTGSMDWRPNVDAMLYFIEAIWPRIVRVFPGTRLAIVGRNPSTALLHRISDIPNVRLTGTVPDVRPFVDSAQVYVVPLRIGGGSRLKILEAMAMEKAVVSTSLGAEGLEIENGRNILIADTPDQFFNAVQRLFTDAPLRQRLGEAGRQLVENRYRWEVLSESLEGSWQKAILARPAFP